MRFGKQKVFAAVYAIAMLMLILDAKTALSGAKEGVTLCLYTVIPSLFPFLFVSGMLSNTLVGLNIPFLRPLGRLCRIPAGGEPLLLLGLIGGYPVGAQNIAHAYCNGQIEKDDARRLLGFCNNAGPAFIFGMMSSMFKSYSTPWLLWLIHIFSAVTVGFLLPGKSRQKCSLPKKDLPTAANALAVSTKTMAEICGWIIIFRIFLSMLQRWIFWTFPDELNIVLYGISELTNGCVALFQHHREGFQFLLGSVFLGFGGLCITMQTISVTKTLGTGYYFPGKLLQTIISFLLSSALQWIIFPASENIRIPVYAYVTAAGIAAGILTWMSCRKKRVEIPCLV